MEGCFLTQKKGSRLRSAAAGGAAGLAAWAATGLDVELLHRCFGGFLIVVGLRELFSRS